MHDLLKGLSEEGHRVTVVAYADERAAFAEATVELLRDEAERERVAGSGRELVERRFEYRGQARKLAESYRGLA